MTQVPDAPGTMPAARLHAPRRLILDRVPTPPAPGPGEALIRVGVVGICGSDLHMYAHGTIGDTPVERPLTLGHEFGGVVKAAGPGAVDGRARTLRPGDRVAVDPARPCGRCELCGMGHPNLCPDHSFTGVYPTDGALCPWMLVPASTAFTLPDTIDDTAAAMLEPLGVAIHALDLAHVRVGHSVAVLGAGPIGLLILQLAKLAGATPIFATEPLPARRELAKRWADDIIDPGAEDPTAAILRATRGRGVDVAIEAAWSDASVQQAIDMTRPGARLVVVGIPGDDRIAFRHSAARRRGLTIAFCRRMKHTYPRAIELAAAGKVDLHSMVTHRFPLEKAPEAFAMNMEYRDAVIKAVVNVDG